ncbi:hypothetical protein Q5W_21925 [Hydrogenophaga sp. PBC]|uniref:hypothetical protein n=1 Tax=Hydrogenophaga sp. PBC TaxID=795665 RepID=UPI00058757C9|nr:hypothetical protein [Hydrogenophaga sp. PBC]AOS81419.1 hypothetical protein Q5W_21925 [Hydrogenophaga sp. PBC]
MLSPKAFLLQECANVRDVLGETLRYKYGADGSKDFYDECLIRLESTEAGVKGCQEGDHDQLALFSKLLQRLTYLIARIERSSIGEYSWPFVEELKDLAVGICSEATLPVDWAQLAGLLLARRVRRAALGSDACQPPEGLRMKISVKILSPLLRDSSSSTGPRCP